MKRDKDMKILCTIIMACSVFFACTAFAASVQEKNDTTLEPYQVLHQKALEHLGKKEYMKAGAYLQKAIELFEANREKYTAPEDIQEYAYMHMNYASVYIHIGDLNKAQEILNHSQKELEKYMGLPPEKK